MKTVQRLLFPVFAISAFGLLALSGERILSFFQVEWDRIPHCSDAAS